MSQSSEAQNLPGAAGILAEKKLPVKELKKALSKTSIKKDVFAEPPTTLAEKQFKYITRDPKGRRKLLEKAKDMIAQFGFQTPNIDAKIPLTGAPFFAETEHANTEQQPHPPSGTVPNTDNAKNLDQDQKDADEKMEENADGAEQEEQDDAGQETEQQEADNANTEQPEQKENQQAPGTPNIGGSSADSDGKTPHNTSDGAEDSLEKSNDDAAEGGKKPKSVTPPHEISEQDGDENEDKKEGNSKEDGENQNENENEGEGEGEGEGEENGKKENNHKQNPTKNPSFRRGKNWAAMDKVSPKKDNNDEHEENDQETPEGESENNPANSEDSTPTPPENELDNTPSEKPAGDDSRPDNPEEKKPEDSEKKKDEPENEEEEEEEPTKRPKGFASFGGDSYWQQMNQALADEEKQKKEQENNPNQEQQGDQVEQDKKKQKSQAELTAETPQERKNRGRKKLNLKKTKDLEKKAEPLRSKKDKIASAKFMLLVAALIITLLYMMTVGVTLGTALLFALEFFSLLNYMRIAYKKLSKIEDDIDEELEPIEEKEEKVKEDIADIDKDQAKIQKRRREAQQRAAQQSKQDNVRQLRPQQNQNNDQNRRKAA